MEPDGEAKDRVVNDEKAAAGKGEEQKVAFYKLFSFADKFDVVLMIVGTLFAIASGLAQPLSSVLLGELINTFGTTPKSHTVEEVSKVALKFVYLAIGSGITSFLQVSCWMVTGERQSVRIRRLYLKAMLGQEIGFFDTQTTTGEVIGRMSADTILIQDAMGEKVGNAIQQALTFLGGFIIAGIKGWLLALILISTIPVLVIVGGFAATITSKISKHEQEAYSEAGNVVEQTIGAIRTVASFTGERHAIEKYNVKLKVAYKATVRQGLTIGAGYGTMLLITFSTYGLAIWLGSKFIISKGYNGGQVMNIMIAIMVGGMSLSQTAPCLRAFAEGQVAAYKMFETIKRTSKIDPYNFDGVMLEDVKGGIELQDVHFRYPARPEVKIFSGFSLQVPSGTTTALVGQSGSGKSTVISLVERFYDPDSGEILIDGVNLKELKLSWIREKIGLVSQEPILFATSIKENIIYGKENATDQEIRIAMELANAAKFIDKMPKGLDTMAGEHGIQLSGGQKQRIAIARAILKNPKILLLDEATSALDVESEYVVQDALVKVMCNRTTVVVAHRLTTIKNADMIAVVHMGEIVEQGSHEELIKNADGAYSHLVSLQVGAKGFEDNCNASTVLSESMNIEKSVYNSESQKLPIDRSVSGCPTSEHALEVSTTGFDTPGPCDVHKNEEHEEKTETDKVPENQKHEEDTRSNKRPEEVSIRRLAHLNMPELPVLLLGTIFASIQGAALPIFGFLLSNVIRVFYEPPREMKKESKFWTLVCVGLALINLTAITLQTYLFGIAGGKLIERIRSRTFKKIVHQEISWFDYPANSSGVVCARLSTDASGVRGLVGDALALIVQNTSTVIVSFIIAFVASWRLALIVLSMSPLLLVQAVIQKKFTKGFSADAKLMYQEASQVATDAVGNIRTIASFCAEKKVMDVYQKTCEVPMRKGVRHGLISGTSYGVSFLLLYSTIAFCFYCGALLVQHGKATFGELFKVVFAFCVAAVAVSQSSDLAPDTAKAKDSATSIFGILDRESAIDSSIDEGITLEEVNGCIEIEHVSFRYPIRPDIQILTDLSLSIPSRQTVALVGESGSGKSTVISLIERFYNPDSGHIYLDGVDIKQLKLRWLREQIGLVSQEPILFNETIRANIAYGKLKNFTEEEMMVAAIAANAHDFISSLPEGYGTLIGERGVLLSGGQKQRIALARVILRHPKILLLDEATSALDAKSEHIVQNAMERIMMNRTTIVIAHRLTTIKGADMIAVVKNGAIVEKGKHDDLMKIVDGEYASLVSLHK